jgi:L-fucose mutarotase
MLKGVDPRVAPELLRDLSRMGHYESLLIADGNFPVGRLGGAVHHLPLPTREVVDAVLSLVPVETGAADAVLVRSDTADSPLDAVQEECLGLFRSAEPDFTGYARSELGGFVDAALASSVAIITSDLFPSCYVIRRGVVRG